MTVTGSFEYRRRVAWPEVDPSGNYQFTAALRYAEEAEIALLRELGFLDRLYPHLPRTFVRADFRAPARFDDEITVVVRIGRVGHSSVEFDFELRRGATLCAEGTWAQPTLGPMAARCRCPQISPRNSPAMWPVIRAPGPLATWTGTR